MNFFVGTLYHDEYLKNKSHKESVNISQKIELSKMKQKDIEKQISCLMIY